MTEINIPMNDWSKKKLRAEKKNATTRTEKYGKKGDVFGVKLDEGTGKTIVKFYKIWNVFKVSLWTVAHIFYRAEGCESPNEFKEVWRDIHPRKGYVSDWKVYLHLFREIDKEMFESEKYPKEGATGQKVFTQAEELEAKEAMGIDLEEEN